MLSGLSRTPLPGAALWSTLLLSALAFQPVHVHATPSRAGVAAVDTSAPSARAAIRPAAEPKHIQTSAPDQQPAGEFGPCDPLVPDNCMLPFPNNFFLREDPSTPTGYRVHLTEETMPKDRKGKTIDPTEWNTLDGFSPIMPIQAYFEDVSIENLPGHWDIERSLDSDCPTILMDAETGELLPHFAELNESTRENPMEAFIVWPIERLKQNHRYIVAMRGLMTNSGQEVQPSEAFVALRDGVVTDNYDIEGRRDLYEDIFSKLEDVGVSQSSLQLAWDFNTASDSAITSRMVYMRDDALNRIPEGGPAYRIDKIEDEFSDNTYRRIYGRMRVPSYMSSPLPGSVLVLDDNGNPEYQGDYWVRFSVLIPRTLVENPRPGRILQYGHGLLGSQGEVEAGYLQEMANRYGYVLCATDWAGMSTADAVPVIRMLLTDLSDFQIIPDRSHQGIINFLALMRLMQGDFRNDEAMTFNGISVVDPEKRSYFGNSQGGILGGVYMAVTTDVDNGVLGVPGAPYSLLLPRSADFGGYFYILKARYPDPLDQALLMPIIQMLWDRAEPSGYLQAISREPFPNTQPHRVLIHYGLMDAQVSWLGAYVMARSIGASVFEGNVAPSYEIPYGFNYVTGDQEQSMMVGYDFNVGDPPTENVPPPEETDTHEKPRRERTAQDQMDYFFNTGVIRPFCDGPCDPS